MIKLDKCFIIPGDNLDKYKDILPSRSEVLMYDNNIRSTLYVTDNEPLVRSIADNEEIGCYFRIESDRSVHKVNTYDRHKALNLGTLVPSFPGIDETFIYDCNTQTHFTLRKG